MAQKVTGWTKKIYAGNKHNGTKAEGDNKNAYDEKNTGKGGGKNKRGQKRKAEDDSILDEAPRGEQKKFNLHTIYIFS